MTPSTCRAMAAEFLERDDENWLRAGTCLLAALYVGPHNDRIAEHTGVPVNDVVNFGYRLRAVGIWRGRSMRYPWLDDLVRGRPGYAAVGFVAQAGVAAGEFVAQPDGDDFSYRIAFVGEGNGLPRWTADQIKGMPHRSTICRKRSPRKVLV